MGKGEIARKEQFLLFQQSVRKICTADTKKQGLVWERLKPYRSVTTHVCPHFLTQVFTTDT